MARGGLNVPTEGWRAAGAGLVAAILLSWFPFLAFILSPFLTLAHELGHTAVLWLFGYPAIPAFDFANGGGVTLSDLEREPSIVLGWAAGAAVLGWWQRERRALLVALAAFAGLYVWTYDSTREALAIALGGHAGEWLFGVLFLYRALTGWGCKVKAEQPLYGFLAFMILFSGLRLGYSLAHDPMAKYWYLQGKGGIDHDLVTGSQILSLRLETLATAMTALFALAIPLAIFAAGRRHSLGAVSEDEEEI